MRADLPTPTAVCGPEELSISGKHVSSSAACLSSLRAYTNDKSRKPMKNLTAISLLSLVLAGCGTTSSGPVSAGADTYVVSRQAGAFPSGREPLLVEALAEANAKCGSVRKAMKLLSTAENAGPYILGNYPKATVIFACV
jgi:hypothetical protein